MHLLLALLILASQAHEPPPSRPQAELAVSAAALLPAYEALRVALATDREAEAVVAAQQLADVADPALRPVVEALIAAPDLAGRRAAFGELSRQLVLRVNADPASPKLKVYLCTMAPGYGYWLQTRPGIANPYMGTAMPACGEEVSMRRALTAAGGAR